MSSFSPQIIHRPIQRSELAAIAEAGFGDMAKAVVDVSSDSASGLRRYFLAFAVAARRSV